MRHVGPTRVELGTRTIFNLLGPLSNPAGVRRQLIGVFSAAWLEPMAEVLRNLGSERVWITHGLDGLDEITTTGPTKVVELKNGVDPRFRGDAGRGGSRARRTGGAQEAATRSKTPKRSSRSSTARPAPIATSPSSTPARRSSSRERRPRSKTASRLGDAAIRSGAARRTLDRLIAVSNA